MKLTMKLGDLKIVHDVPDEVVYWGSPSVALIQTEKVIKAFTESCLAVIAKSKVSVKKK